MRPATKENLLRPCTTCKTPEGQPCKPGSPAHLQPRGHVHGSRARQVQFA